MFLNKFPSIPGLAYIVGISAASMGNCSTESESESFDSSEARLHSSLVLPKSERIGEFAFCRCTQVPALSGVLVLWRISGSVAKITQVARFVPGRRGQSHSGFNADGCTVLSRRLIRQLYIAGR